MVTLAAGLAAETANAQSEGLPWRSDFDAAQAEAAESGKLILAHFWTESCGPCKLLEQRVFSQPAVAMAVAGAYVPVKINAEFPIGTLGQDLGVRGYPGMPIVNGDGEKVGYISGFSPPSAFIEKLKEPVEGK